MRVVLPPALLPLEVLAVLRVLVPAREAAWATTAVSGEARRDTSAYCLPGKKKTGCIAGGRGGTHVVVSRRWAGACTARRKPIVVAADAHTHAHT